MAASVLTDAFLSVNGVDLSDHVTKLTCEDSWEFVDVTLLMSSARVLAPAQKNGKVTAEFFQDFAAAKVDATLRPLIGIAGVALEVRNSRAIRSATNPSLLMTGQLFEYRELDGAAGSASSILAEFVNASDQGIVYSIAPPDSYGEGFYGDDFYG